MKYRLFKFRAVALASAAALAVVAVLVGLASCSKADNEFSSYPCRFVFNTSRHGQSAALLSTVGGTGVFCKVSKTVRGGAQYYHFETNAGLTDDVIFTTEDQQSTVLLGLNGSIIIGYGNLDVPKTFYAYDTECPNCFSPDAIPLKSRPLKLTTAGMAVCDVCHRQYNLNTGGNVVGGDNGRKLTRYHASYQADGTVVVIN